MNRSRILLFAAFLGFTALAQAQAVKDCLAHHPKYVSGQFEVSYAPGCTGHDEPELFPVSSAPGSARDLTWTVVLPTGGTTNVSDVGPTFWFGGTVTDPKSLFGQAFVELQFYPDSTVTKCFSNGAFKVNFTPNTFTACSPIFGLTPNRITASHFNEPTEFNAMLEDSSTPGSALQMFAGDTITVHYFVTPAADGFHIAVTDLTTGHSGTIILNSAATGPFMPFYDTQAIGNSLGWGTVNDAPNSFVWEIGHESTFIGGALCVPGQTVCDSYNSASWLGFSPIQIKSVTFGDGSTANTFAAVSDQGGKAEVALTCATFGGAFCIYPWYTLGKTGFHYGVDYPDTQKDFGQADQFTQTTQCGGPFGANTTFCSTILK